MLQQKYKLCKRCIFSLALITFLFSNKIVESKILSVDFENTEQIAIKNNELKNNKETKEEYFTVEATAYCNCSKCCGKKPAKDRGKTRSGLIASRGTVAVPKDVIPLGTKLHIEGLKDVLGFDEVRAEDTGSAIKVVNGIVRIDIWMKDHKEALKFGRQKFNARIIK